MVHDSLFESKSAFGALEALLRPPCTSGMRGESKSPSDSKNIQQNSLKVDMMKMRVTLLMIIAASLIGCSSAPIVLNYAPSSTMSLDGELEVGDFRYLPGETNEKVAPNQIRNTALGSVKLEKNINEYFETALFTEARFVGLNVQGSGNVVSGEIIEFLIDDLGFSVDWTLQVRYVVEQEGSKKCYDEVHTIAKNSAKFANPFGTLNEVMKLNIEKLFQDSSFIECVVLEG